MKGFFKIKMRRFNRWFVFNYLPYEPIYDEWLYIDRRGVPILYWNKELGSLMLL
jgi:hypothetical protein